MKKSYWYQFEMRGSIVVYQHMLRKRYNFKKRQENTNWFTGHC